MLCRLSSAVELLLRDMCLTGTAGKYTKGELVEYYSETHGEWCADSEYPRLFCLESADAGIFFAGYLPQ